MFYPFTFIKKSSGYFVHHFAPSSLPRIPKNVVFVIDQSGSMDGRKIQQVQLLHRVTDTAGILAWFIISSTYDGFYLSP